MDSPDSLNRIYQALCRVLLGGRSEDDSENDEDRRAGIPVPRTPTPNVRRSAVALPEPDDDL